VSALITGSKNTNTCIITSSVMLCYSLEKAETLQMKQVALVGWLSSPSHYGLTAVSEHATLSTPTPVSLHALFSLPSALFLISQQGKFP
jgi:hypothetical protein